MTGSPTADPSRPYLVEARRLPEAGVLRLTWSDGHRGDYDYRTLRGWCPCAMCQGHGTGPVRHRPYRGDVRADHIEPVGNYALSIRWSDGHGTGIYRFDFLRELCPCDACAAARSSSSSSST